MQSELNQNTVNTKLDPKLLEREAYDFLSQDKLIEAYRMFRKAAQRFKLKGNYKQAALCFASAASCWSKKSGERIFNNAAVAYEEAAKAAIADRNYQYGSLLYKHAAINHERDGELFDFSHCFYLSKETARKHFARSLFFLAAANNSSGSKETDYSKNFIMRFFSWLVLTFSYIIWGHGEKPSRTFFAGLLIIFTATLLYLNGSLANALGVFKPTFFDSLYFSVVTFTTVGYGDIFPAGFSKLVAIFESLSGLFIIPLFVIGLSRKYLRA
tara:strand:+ start:2297 stop:3106 length:810 start_codon:yes stop_codon:yes gene_type:complete